MSSEKQQEPGEHEATRIDWKRMVPGKHDLQFRCEWAVYPEGSGSSLCYVTSEERAQAISDRLNLINELLTDNAALRAAVEASKDKDLGEQ